MPFIHKGCGGTVGVMSGKCNKCGKKFKPNSKNPNSMPDGVYFDSSEKIQKLKAKASSKGSTSYASWADKAGIPGVAPIASRLPNIPRWGRILVTAGIVIGIVFLIRGCIL